MSRHPTIIPNHLTAVEALGLLDARYRALAGEAYGFGLDVVAAAHRQTAQDLCELATRIRTREEEAFTQEESDLPIESAPTFRGLPPGDV